MSDSKERLIEAATRKLSGDAESKSSAGRLLETLWKSRSDQETTALNRWEAQDSRKRRILWPMVFYLIAAVVVTFAISKGVSEALQILKFDKYLYPGSDRKSRMLELRSDVQPAIIWTKARWDSAPKNPAYFADYCRAFVSLHKELPPDFLEQAQRIDPQNAFFPYWAVEMEEEPASVVNAALSILHESRDLEFYKSYRVPEARKNSQVLLQAIRQDDHARSSIYQSVSFPNLFDTRSLPNRVEFHARLFQIHHDFDEWDSLKEDVDAYLRKLSQGEAGFLGDDLPIEDYVSFLEGLHSSAIGLGLREEAAELDGQIHRLEKLNHAREAAKYQIAGADAGAKLGLSHQSICQITNLALHPPALTDREAKPGRMIDYEFLVRLLAFAAAVLFALVAGASALYRIRSPKVIRDLAARMTLLLTPVDWTYLFLSGFAPFAYFLCITRLTGLGGMDRNVSGWGIEIHHNFFPLQVMQFASAVLMALILPILVARWRIGKRAGFFGIRQSLSGYVALASAAALIPVLGGAVMAESAAGLKISYVLGVIPLTWLVAVALRAMILGGTHHFHLCTRSRILAPTYLAAMVLLLLTTPYFRWSQQRWFEKDPLNELDPTYPSLTRFEYETSVAARKELREALGYDTP